MTFIHSTHTSPTTSRPLALFALSAVALMATGCGAKREAVATTTDQPQAAAATTTPASRTSRDMVLWNGSQIGDLYWNGQISASDGNRWDVGFLPGIAPTGTVVAKSWRRGGDYYRFFFPADADRNPAGQCWRFTSKTMVKEFLVEGIAKDVGDGSANISSACREKPFGWPAAVVYYAIKDYVLWPAGRLVAGTVGTVAGGAGTAVCGTGQAAFPTLLASGDIATVGTIYPMARLVWHQPAWALSVVSAEPKPEQNGHWTLLIIDGPDQVQRQPASAKPRID